MPMAARCLMSRKSALGFACTSFASASACLGPCVWWSATPSLAATYRACVVLYPCVKLKSSCLGDSIDRGRLLSFWLELGAKRIIQRLLPGQPYFKALAFKRQTLH